MNDVNLLLKHAKMELDCLNDGEVFLLRELFKGYEWNRIPRKKRLLLGTLFLNYVESGENKRVKAISKSSSNQQKYIIKEV